MSIEQSTKEEARQWVERLKQSATPQEQMQAAARLRGVGVRVRGAVATRGSLSRAGDALVSHQELVQILSELRIRPVEVRREVAFALGEVGGEDLVRPLAELARDPVSSVRLIAVEALGKIGGPEAVQVLMAVAKEDPSEDIRSLAVEALGSLAVQERKVVLTRGTVKTRAGGASKLESLSPEAKRLVEALQHIGQEDQSPRVRDAVLDVLSAVQRR